MPETLSFTGTQYTGGYIPQIRQVLDAVPRFDRYVSGACTGFDTLAGAYVFHRFPTAEHVVIVPANDYKVCRWWETDTAFKDAVQVIEMPVGSDFKDRNQRLVDEATELYYCALFTERHGNSRRSGTWQTIRMAQRAGIPVDGVILNPETED